MRVCLDLPEAVMPQAALAVEMWSRAVIRWRRLVPVQASEACDVTVREYDGDAPAIPLAIAWVDAIGGTEVWLRRDWYEADVKGILLHELGHILGAEHVAGTLMTREWSPGAYRCPDRTTVAQVAAWNGVDLAVMGWCE